MKKEDKIKLKIKKKIKEEIIKGKGLIEVKKETLKEQAENFIKRIGKCKTGRDISEETMYYIFVMTEVTTLSSFKTNDREVIKIAKRGEKSGKKKKGK